jgi:hypothetical protein
MTKRKRDYATEKANLIAKKTSTARIANKPLVKTKPYISKAPAKTKDAVEKQTSPLHFPTTSDVMTTEKYKTVSEVFAVAMKCDYWKAKALGYKDALQQQQKGLSRMKKRFDRINAIVAKREKAAAAERAIGKEMAKRLDGIRMFTDSAVKVEKVEKKAE